MKEEIDSKTMMLGELQTQLDLIPEFNELQKLGPGKSFGEKALITNSLRAANVVATRDCHFATMVKVDYDKVLRKIELKVQNKIIVFMQQLPYLKFWTRRMLLNFSYYLTVKQYPLGHVIFKEGDECEYVAIVKQGTYEMKKKIPSEVKDESGLRILVR